MGLILNNIVMTVSRNPEMSVGISNNREWKKYEVVCDMESRGVTHPLHFIAWNRTAERLDGMLLKKGSIIEADILIKSELFKGWWKTQMIIEDAKYIRQDTDASAPINKEDIMFVDTDSDDLPF